MKRYNLTDWGVLLLAMNEIPGISGRLSASSVEDFAATELEKIAIDHPLLDVIASLAMSCDIPTIELREELERICQVQEVNLDNSRRKWRLVSLEYILSELDADPVYGLIKLSEFWSAWGWPIDAPFSMRNDSSHIGQEEYHSDQNFKHVISDHREWIVKEHSLLAG